MSQRENAIGALFAVLGRLSLGTTVKRNAALPERIADHAMAILRAGETRVEQQQQPDGSTRLDVIVEQMEARMARSISQGSGLAPTLERRYGLNPAAGAMR